MTTSSAVNYLPTNRMGKFARRNGPEAVGCFLVIDLQFFRDKAKIKEREGRNK